MSAALLSVVDACFDAIPRTAGTAETVGPFTLFLAEAGTGWDFYARPSLGERSFTADDVRRVLARQRELGVPRAIEWVDDVTPALLPVVREAVPRAEVELDPLLVLPATTVLSPADPRVRVLTGDEEEFLDVLGAIHAGFDHSDTVTPRPPGRRPAKIADGTLVVVGAFAADGTPVGGGSAAPRGGAAELNGIATLPRARRQGYAGAVVACLAAACRAAGVTTVYLSAGSDEAAGVYRAVGFERVGTSCILQVD